MRAALYILAPLGFLAAALTLYALLLPACGLRASLGLAMPYSCPAQGPSPARAAMLRESERRAALEAELRGLERELLALGPCPVIPPEPVAPPPEPAPVSPPPERPPEPEPEIDAERWREQDVSLMEGCWMLDSDYRVRNIDTNEVLSVPYWRACFDAQGQGTQELRFSNGATCEAPMRAEFRGERLWMLDGANLQCSDGSQLFEREIECRLDQSGGAQCESRQGGRGGASNVRLRRE